MNTTTTTSRSPTTSVLWADGTYMQFASCVSGQHTLDDVLEGELSYALAQAQNVAPHDFLQRAHVHLRRRGQKGTALSRTRWTLATACVYAYEPVLDCDLTQTTPTMSW